MHVLGTHTLVGAVKLQGMALLVRLLHCSNIPVAAPLQCSAHRATLQHAQADVSPAYIRALCLQPTTVGLLVPFDAPSFDFACLQCRARCAVFEAAECVIMVCV